MKCRQSFDLSQESLGNPRQEKQHLQASLRCSGPLEQARAASLDAHSSQGACRDLADQLSLGPGASKCLSPESQGSARSPVRSRNLLPLRR